MDVRDRLHDSGQGLGLGFLLAAVNPKNLLMAASAGVIVGGAGLTFGQAVIVIIIFVLLAGCTVIIPMIGYLIASARLAGPLDRLRVWLVDNNAVIGHSAASYRRRRDWQGRRGVLAGVEAFGKDGDVDMILVVG
jgi:threonine/homoserine/homoserine lactone efflux protein